MYVAMSNRERVREGVCVCVCVFGRGDVREYMCVLGAAWIYGAKWQFYA